MDSVTLSEDDVETLWDHVGNESNGLRTIEIQEWDGGGKWQTQSVVVEHLDSGWFYMFNVQRTGSYYSDYEYEMPNKAVRVKKVERTISEWVIDN